MSRPAPSVEAVDGAGAIVFIDEVAEDGWQRVREIRLATLFDAPYAFGSTYEGEKDQPEQWWRQRLRDGRWYIVRQGEADLAVAMLRLDTMPESFVPEVETGLRLDGEVPWIRSVWTRPDARGRKLADIVCLQVCAVAAQAGYDTTILGVRADNLRAQAAYRRMGFTRIGTFMPSSAQVEAPNPLMARSSG